MSDIFSALLPMAVQQAMSACDLHLTEIVNGEKRKLQIKTHMLNRILAFLNLPAAIEDTTDNCLPESLKRKSPAVRERGGIETIQLLINQLPALLQWIIEILKECERMLNDEEESDNELRSKFGSNWVRTPSAKLNEPLKSNLLKFKQIICTAMSADGIVKEKYNTHKDKIALLCLPEDQLLSGIPTGSPVASCSVDQLKRLMHEVDVLKAERETLIGELESAAIDTKAKFLSALSSEGGVNEEALETLSKVYGLIGKRIRDNISRQEQLVNEIQTANNEFSKEKSLDGSGAQRESMLSDLASAHDAFMELTGNLKERLEFYNNLTKMLVKFQNNINDYCLVCKIRRNKLCKDLQKHIVSIATQPSSLQPPSSEDVTLLAESMKELLIKGNDYDVKITVKDKQFQAHRIILRTRSPVFAMMLTHDSKESITGAIKIEDCDPDSFDEFLLYLYSGTTENLTPAKALHLYYTADKYDIPALKKRCAILLKTSLSVESICDVLLLATRHNEKELLEQATKFFAQNMREILVTVHWQKFLSENPIEGNELYIKSMEILVPRK